MVVTRAVVAFLVVGAVCLAALGCSGQSSARKGVADARFVIMPWEIGSRSQILLGESGHGIDSLRACGFDTVAFARPGQLAEVEKAGLRALVGRPADVHVRWRTLSDRDIAARVRELVRASGGSDAVLGYFLADEPGVAEFPALAKAVAAVKRLAPGKLAYVNLLPSYATRGQLGVKSYARYLERYVSEVEPQLVSYDNFGIALSTQPKARGRRADYYRNLLQVRRVTLRHRLPFWVALSSNRIRPRAAAPSPASLRLQAFTALAAGASGLTWYTYYATPHHPDAPIDEAGRRTATWSYLRKVDDRVRRLARSLRGLRSTGVYFTPPAPADGLPSLPGGFVRSIESRAPVMVGEFADATGKRYALVVNLSLKHSAKVVVRVGAKGSRRSLRLVAGQGTLVKP